MAICKTFGGMASFDTAKVSNPRNCINVSCYSVCILHGSVRLDARSEFHKWLGNGIFGLRHILLGLSLNVEHFDHISLLCYPSTCTFFVHKWILHYVMTIVHLV